MLKFLDEEDIINYFLYAYFPFKIYIYFINDTFEIMR